MCLHSVPVIVDEVVSKQTQLKSWMVAMATKFEQSDENEKFEVDPIVSTVAWLVSTVVLH